MTQHPASDDAGGRRRPHLVVARVGDGSLHPTWTQGERTFDLVVDYYGSTPGRWAGTAERVFETKGSKWVGLHTLLTQNPDLLDGYEAVWFPDDDLATDAATISAMFALHTELGLGLSQPSLTTDSYFTHLMTLTHPGFAVRWTTFVEVMAPVFSRAALQACLPTFAQSRSGYGLDLVWQGILPGLGLESAILDCLSVQHTRPLGSGSLYDGMTEAPHREGARVARAHGMPTPHEFRTLRATLIDGTEVEGDRAEALALAGPPVPTVQDVPAWDLYLTELSTRAAAGAPAAGPALVRAPRPAVVDRRATALDDLDEDRPVVLIVGRAPQRPAASTTTTTTTTATTPPRSATTLGGPARPAPSPSSAGPAAPAPAGVSAPVAWRSAGWQVVELAAGEPAELARHLRDAERFTHRVLDLTETTSHAVARAVAAATSVGCRTVVRLTGENTTCRHAVDAEVRRALGRCEVCRTEWAAVAAATTLFAGDPTTAARLVESGVSDPVADGVDPSTFAHAPVPVAPAGGTTVVVFARNDRDELHRLVEAVTHQRALTTAPEVLIVPATTQRTTSRSPVDRTRMDVHVLANPGAQGFSEALALASRDRVLVLDGSDVPGPWCLYDHEVGGAACAGVVRGEGRAAVTEDDPFTTALQDVATVGTGSVHVPAPGARASAPTSVVQQVAAVHAMVSAGTAAAILCSARVLRLERPTHAVAAFTDLETVRSGTVLASLATAALGSVDPAVTAALTPELVHWTHRGTENLRLAAQMTEHSGEVLRTAVVNPVLGHRATDALGQVLSEELAAHWAAPQLATDAVRRAVADHGHFTLGVSVRDARLLPLLGWLASSDAVDQSVLQVRVALDPSDGDPAQFTSMLADQLRRSGVDLDRLPLVDLVVPTVPLARSLDVDVVLRRGDERWYPGLPVPLVALEPQGWLSFLGMAALVASLSSPAAAERSMQPC